MESVFLFYCTVEEEKRKKKKNTLKIGKLYKHLLNRFVEEEIYSEICVFIVAYRLCAVYFMEHLFILFSQFSSVDRLPFHFDIIIPLV